jgi:hypothetical protein
MGQDRPTNCGREGAASAATHGACRESALPNATLPCGSILASQRRDRRCNLPLVINGDADMKEAMSAETTASKQRGRPFQKGRSGNPSGRPLGARNAATLLAEQLLDGETEALIRKVVQKAKQGNVPALRICLDRILPPRWERPVRFALPELRSVSDATKAIAAVTLAVAKGEVGPTEAAELSKLIESYVRAVEATELEQRLLALEQRFK